MYLFIIHSHGIAYTTLHGILQYIVAPPFRISLTQSLDTIWSNPDQ